MSKKKTIRKNFRTIVFKRDNYSCLCCGKKSDEKYAESELDAHHITDRNKIENGGYVKENGITLCVICHLKAEEFQKTGMSLIGFGTEDLYEKIGSSYECAVKESRKSAFVNI